ncbi:MAG: hypothetical protein AAB460_03240 [Patescibacteria group bacterium]
MTENKDTDSPLESLSQELYKPGEGQTNLDHRARFHQDIYDVKKDWTHEHGLSAGQAGEQNSLFSRMKLTPKHHTLVRWVFVAAAAFFLVALGVAAFFLTGNRNILSTDKISITVTGPAILSAGDPLPLAIEIINNNTSTLEVADLVVEYPQGTRSAEDVRIELPRYRVGLGDLSPGERIATTTRAVIFGEKGEEQEIIVSLEYRVSGSSAVFVKERKFIVTLDDTPVRISVDAPNRINSGNDIALEVTVESNSPTPLEDVVLSAEYPFGFTFESGDPDPTFSEAVWSLGDLAPETKKTLRIKGTLEGQDDEERIFRFEIGVARGGDPSDIGTSFARAEHTVIIARPFVDLSLSVEGKSGETFVVRSGETISLDINWRNNLSTKLADAVIELEIDGNAVDEGSVRAQGGFYDSQKNKIIWDKRSLATLETISAGEGGRAAVGFDLKPASSLSGTTVNSKVGLILRLLAKPVGGGDVPEEVRVEHATTLNLASSVILDAYALHAEGSIDNTGPMPPRAESETTYTIVWSLSNSLNDISDSTVRASLPPYVSWKNVVNPLDEDVEYDSSTGVVIWRVGTVRAGVGYRSASRDVAFQIGLTPSVTQVGTAPALIEDVSFSGHDGFAGVDVTAFAESMSTLLLEDSRFDPGDEKVRD